MFLSRPAQCFWVDPIFSLHGSSSRAHWVDHSRDHSWATSPSLSDVNSEEWLRKDRFSSDSGSRWYQTAVKHQPVGYSLNRVCCVVLEIALIDINNPWESIEFQKLYTLLRYYRSYDKLTSIIFSIKLEDLIWKLCIFQQEKKAKESNAEDQRQWLTNDNFFCYCLNKSDRVGPLFELRLVLRNENDTG